MKKKNLQERTAFISQNMNILTSQIPEEFLHSWVATNLDTYIDESESYKTEFCFMPLLNTILIKALQNLRKLHKS